MCGDAYIFNAPQTRNTAVAAALKVFQPTPLSGFTSVLRVEIDYFFFFEPH